MKIARIRATPVLTPLEAPTCGPTACSTVFAKCVVAVKTTDSAMRVAEAPGIMRRVPLV